jgi:hypothetical protein
MNISETSFPARDRLNDRMVRQVRYTGPSTYVAGGDAVNASNELGMAEVYSVLGTISNGTAVLISHFVYSTQKIMFFVPNTGVEVTGDLSTYTGTLTFFGKG